MASTLMPETLPTRRPVLQEPPASPPAPQSKPERLVSLDAYRGFIMLVMASSGFAFATAVTRYGNDGKYNLLHQTWNLFGTTIDAGPVWRFLAFQFEHVAWVGCSFWDLIQPSFMFMVGVALPYSYASRKAKNEADDWIFVHTVWRAALLVALGVFLSSNGAEITRYTFVNVLTQIGLGYVFVYLLRGRGLLLQLAALVVILAGYTALFAAYPLPADNKDWQAVGVKDGEEILSGFSEHWAKNANAAHDFDEWFLNLFPQPKPPEGFKPANWEKRGFTQEGGDRWRFAFNEGGYQTLNFVPSMATMLLGLMAGEMLRGRGSRQVKFVILILAGAVCLTLGLVAGAMGVPIVKRIWTPSWALYSSGWTFFMLAAFYGVIDVIGWKRWAFPLVVVGMNSIAIYCMSQLMRGWIRGTMTTHLPTSWFVGPYGLILQTTLILIVLWLICLWMYRRKIFLKI